MSHRLSSLVLMGSLAFVGIGCSSSNGGGGGGGSGGGGGGGAGGTPGWSVFYPQDELDSAVVSVIFTTHTGGSGVPESQPAPDDPWRLAMTNRTFDLVRDNGDGHAEAHLSFAINGDTIDITGSTSASSGGTITSTASAGIEYATLCYRPASGAQMVRFTTDMSKSTFTVGGENSIALVEFQSLGMDCKMGQVISLGMAGSPTTTCTSATIDVSVDSDGQACLNGAIDKPDVDFSAGGGDASAAGGGSATTMAQFTVTASTI